MPYRPSVSIFARADSLALSVVEKLLGNFCSVTVVSDEEGKWQEITSHVSQREFLKITTGVTEACEYSLLIDPALSLPSKDYESFFDFYQRETPKSLVVLPYSFGRQDQGKFQDILRRVGQLDGNIGTILVGDLVGPRVEPAISELVGLIQEARGKNDLLLTRDGEEFYPVAISFVAKEIVRSLLSFGPYGEILAIVGPKVADAEIAQRLQKFFPQAGVKYQAGQRQTFGQEVKKLIDRSDVGELIAESLEWQRSHPQEKGRVEPKKKKETVKKVSGQKKYFGFVFWVLLILVLPYLLLLTSLGFLFASFRTLPSGKLGVGEVLFKAAKGSSFLALAQFGLYVRVPGLGPLFLGSQQLSSLVYRIGNSGSKGVETGKKMALMAVKIIGDEVYDAESLTKEISLDIDWLYKETSFIQGEVETLGGLPGRVVKSWVATSEIDSLREKALETKKIVEELPFLLGEDSPKTYLVLFQNNMELRPTGGFIGSFAFITFDGGRMADVSVMDVYAADGQLKGHVEPPAAIKEHLGEANWYLRDANWDPDFPVSAARAEWFLDKELDKKVEGVIAVDLEFAKKVLEGIGSITLADYGETVNAQNLYAITQREAEENFFPGSYQKASFLTALSRELVTRISQASEKELTHLAKASWESLSARNIQAFFHNRRVQNAVSNLGFDGSVKEPNCAENCYADWFALVDANLGVNKANYFIKRSVAFQVYLSEGQVKRFLTVSLENKANPALGLSGRYKSYLRVILPQETLVNDALVSAGNDTNQLTPDVSEVRGRKEVGVLVEVGGGQKKDVTFSWEEEIPLSFSPKGEYRLYVRKQAGTVEDGLSLSVFLPGNTRAEFEPNYFLTKDEAYVYNTTLTRDFFSRISW
ncbi:MAG: DUF4012 domain-containing protein [Patescibacteria group bacterium]